MRIIILQQKIDWINNLRAIGILAVILGHIASPFGAFIFSWHMPLFFILAGFFIRFELVTKDFIVKDFKRLMIPYFIFAIFGLLLETVKRIALHRENLDYLHEIQGIFIWMDMPSLINTYGFVLWFLPALFFGRVFLFLISKQILSILIQSVIILTLFSLSFLVNLPFGVDNALNAVIFIFIGSLFFRFYQESKKLYILPFVLAGLVFYFGIPALDMANKNYENVVINIFWAIAIIFIFIAALKKVNFKSKLLTVWGGETMLLFIIHPYTNNIAHIIVGKLHFGDWYLKFLISLVLLQGVLLIKQRFENRGIFKYV